MIVRINKTSILLLVLVGVLVLIGRADGADALVT